MINSSSSPARRERRRGQALVESALILLTFLVTFIGILDFAQVFFVHQSLVERVRDGLRWGVVRPYDSAAIQNVVMYGPPAVANATPFMGLTAANVQVQRFDVGTEQDRISVRIIDYPYLLMSPLIAKTLTMNWAVAETLGYEFR